MIYRKMFLITAADLRVNELYIYVMMSNKNKLRGFSRLSAKLVLILADRGCRVVSATDPHDR
jgi:hypothetical protein